MNPAVHMTICPSPFSTAQERCVMAPGISIAEMLRRSGVDAPGLHVFCNDRLIPAGLRESFYPAAGDSVAVRAIPGHDGDGDKDPARTILQIAVLAASIWAGQYHAAYGAIVGVVGNLAVNALVPPPTANLEPLGGFGLEKNYAISGTRNQSLPFGCVPRVLGRARIYPPFAAKPYTETQANTVFAHMLYCLGPGPLDKSELKIGETLLSQYEGVDYEFLTGNQVSKYYPSQIHQDDLSILLPGTLVLFSDKYQPGWTPDWTVQTTLGDTTRFSVDFYSPSLTYYYSSRNNSSSRDLHVVFAYEIRDHATGVLVEPSSLVRENMEASYFSVTGVDNKAIGLVGAGGEPVRGSAHFTMPYAGQWDIYVRKDHTYTLPETDSYTDGPAYDDIYWTAMRSEVSSAPPVNVRNESIEFIALRIKGSDQLNGVVDTFNLVCQAHHPVYSGGSWTVQATRNPAWVYASVLTDSANKRALSYSRLDTGSLAAFAAACTANGYTFDAVLTGRAPILELMRQICAVGRASQTMVDGKYGVVMDVAQSVPIQTFSPRNSWGYHGSRVFADIPHALRCKFTNAAGQPDEVIVYDDGYSAVNATKFASMDMVGVSDPDHAWKLGRYHLAVLRLRPDVHQVSADIEHIVATRGDLVELCGDGPATGLSQGRIKTVAIDGTDVTITIDETVEMVGGTDYGIRVRTLTGTVACQVTTVAGSTKTLTCTLAPAASAMLAADDHLAFGILGSETRQCIVREIVPGPDNGATLYLVDAAPDVHSAATGEIPAFDPNITLPPDPSQTAPPVPVIDAIVSDESVAQLADDGTLTNRIVVSYHVPSLGNYVLPTGIECQYRAVGAPYLVGDVWSDVTPGAGSVAWNQHSLYVNGDLYTIAAGSTSDQYIYWAPGDTAYTTTDSAPTDPVGILIAVNTAGAHTLADIADAATAWIKAQQIDVAAGTATITGVLTQNVYRIRVRSISEYGAKSAWAYSVHIVAGQTTPPAQVSNIRTTAGSANAFVGRDLDIVWDVTTIGGARPKFEITITHGGADLRIETVAEAAYRYTYAMNVEDGAGSASNAVTIKIRSFNTGGYSATVTATFTNPAPSVPGSLAHSPWMGGIQFTWAAVTDSDLAHYRYRTRIESEGWSAYAETTDRRVNVFLNDTQDAAYPGGATVYIEVQAVDTFGTASTAAAYNGETGSLNIPATTINDWADISAAFYEVPVLRDFLWANNSPSSGYIAWTSGSLWYNGDEYVIDAGNTNKHWTYWDPEAAGGGSSSADLTTNYSTDCIATGRGYHDGSDAVGYITGVGTLRTVERFNVASIDPSWTITDVQLRVGQIYAKIGSPTALTVCRYGTSHGENDPETDSDVNLFSRCAGTAYAAFGTLTGTGYTGWLSLGATAIADLEWCRDNAQTIWSVGLKEATEAATERSYNLSEDNDTYPAQIRITYTVPGASTTEFSATDDESAIPQGAFVIAVNNAGTYSLVWNNAVANQVIGSAWIRDAAIVNAKIANLAVTNAKINDLDAIKINAGYLSAARIQAGTITASKLSGTGFGTLEITSGKILINSADGLDIGGSGNIRVLGGGDINMIGDNFNPGRLYFKGTTLDVYLSINGFGDLFYIVGEAGIDFAIQGFDDITLASKNSNTFRTDYDVNNSCLILQFNNSSSKYISLQTRHAGTTREVRLVHDASTLMLASMNDNTMDLGQASYRWKAVYAVNGTIQTSDERFKEQIAPVGLGLDFLCDLEPIEFRHIGDAQQRLKAGLSAQQVLDVVESRYPGSQCGAVYYDAASDIYGINYAEMVPIIIRAIQELNAKGVLKS